MPKKTSSDDTASYFKDTAEFIEKNQTLLKEAILEQHWQINYNLNLLLNVWQEFNIKVLENPDKVLTAQLNYLQDYLTLCSNFTQNFNLTSQSNLSTDHSAANPQYSHYLFNFIKNNHNLLSQHTHSLVQSITNNEEKLQARLAFFTRQFMEAISPANFIATNPEVLEAILTSNGANLRAGLKQFAADIQQGKGALNIQMSDPEYFKLGENIAATPGKVIYQNDLMQLIQYNATTAKVHQRPILIVPPWINKYYILDLQTKNSFVKWLVDQGHTVFLISWVNPGREHSNKIFDDYVEEGPATALKIITQITGKNRINTLGYCVGGTLLACLVAKYTEEKKCPIASATYLTTLLDFSESGELGIFIDEQQIALLEQHMQEKGYLEGQVMASVFSALRANDLIWNNFVNNYLLGKKPAPFDLLYWNADSTNIPEKVHSFYLRQMYLYNNLIKPNQMRIKGTPLDLSKITIPSYFLAAKSDHIVPWQACYNGLKYYGGDKKFVLTASGHVAGVINPPEKQKYSYWLNEELPEDPKQWERDAIQYSGSWWTDWAQWLKLQAGAKIAVPKRQGVYKSIEDAPGTYVKLRA
ncbi:MAG TPA: class I poly(R)-hydroxyalkanoic acid synthase [Gammaproteobacteria bacterium]|nr:class I poly(R)-hydroxyalkanoic acid synthase [Gammaproteobacteria bacterium]